MVYKDDELMHYGTPRHSGRYPWGSGKDPYQRTSDWLARVHALEKEGLSNTEIAKQMGFEGDSAAFRAAKAEAKDQRREIEVARAKSLQEDGHSLAEIAKIMGYKNDSSVRSLLNPQAEARMMAARNTAEFLKKQIDEKGMIDVGSGVELYEKINVSREKFNQALYILEAEGYPIYGGRVSQVTNGDRKTTIKVACPPGTEHKDIYDFSKIHSIDDYISHDGGETFDKGFVYPKSMDSKRLQIRYAEDGGIDKDGVIEIRRNVPDLDLGGSNYAQVRILVDNDRYLKGMAVYSDDMPPGVDVMFNTNKKAGTPMRDVLKKIKDDPDNPFGSLIKEHGGQSYYIDEHGKKQLSLINKRAEEGDWDEWANKIPSQFLGKQPKELIKRQLNLTMADKQAEFDEICSLTNPTVKKHLLKSYADDCDAAAVHLKAVGLPGQRYQVILPLTSIKDKEVYAPNFENGTQIALVRYPHGGTFEIPILTVNNKQREGKNVLGTNPKDAIGINSKVAERLSGADFDGDTVMCIPITDKVKIKSTPPLEGLKDFDPKMEYPYHEGMKVMKNTQNEMGKISNLITDMTLKGAGSDELARAVRHSMVVIDAEKHKLDYKRSEAENGIAALKREYQGEIDPDTGRLHTGASTLLSRAKNKKQVLKRVGSPKIDPETGEQYWTEVREEYVDKKGKTRVRMQNSTKMAETSDAFTLVSEADTAAERAYAEYANWCKAQANRARKEMLATKDIPYSASAKTAYQAEVSSLMAKLNVSEKNAPRERHAQTLANAEVKAKKQDNPDMSKKEEGKIGQQALARARLTVGAKRIPVEVTDREWEAIQAGAITKTKLEKIIGHMDADKLRERATPRTTTALSSAKINKIQAMAASGYSTADIAKALGCSTSTVLKHLK